MSYELARRSEGERVTVLTTLGVERTMGEIAASLERAPPNLAQEFGSSSLALHRSPKQDDAILEDVSVVIVTRNRPEEFRRCLDRLKEVIGTAEVIAVDDCSQPRYVDLLGFRARIIRNNRRMYLNPSRNIGASLSKGKYILFVDDDNKIGLEAIQLLARVLRSQKSIAVASPVILDEKVTIWFAGGLISQIGAFTRFYFRGRSGRALPSGLFGTRLFHSCFMISRTAFVKAGGFDGLRFPMYLGEADLSERLRGLGYGMAIVPQARAIHSIESHGLTGLLRNVHITEPARAYFVGRNRILFMRKNRNTRTFLAYLVLFHPAFAAVHVLAILVGAGRSRLKALLWAYFRGWKDGISGRTDHLARFPPVSGKRLDLNRGRPSTSGGSG